MIFFVINLLDNTSFSFAHILLSPMLCFIRFSARAIESLCNQLMKRAWTSNPEWLFAVPLLHFLRGDSKPFEEPDIRGSPQDLVWWGAEKLEIEEFQQSVKQ